MLLVFYHYVVYIPFLLLLHYCLLVFLSYLGFFLSFLWVEILISYATNMKVLLSLLLLKTLNMKISLMLDRTKESFIRFKKFIVRFVLNNTQDAAINNNSRVFSRTMISHKWNLKSNPNCSNKNYEILFSIL